MESISSAILLLLGMVAFANYRNGTLPRWLQSKFFNSADPSAQPSAFDSTTDATATMLSFPQTATGLGGALGNLIWPVTGKITSTFGENRGDHTHAGIDIAASTGTPIKAARGGTVTYAGPSGNYGLRVDVDNGSGGSELYAHLSRIAVTLGQRLNVGDVIGYVGSTGDATGPHLHFELRDNGSPIDPSPHLSTQAA